MTAPSQNVFTPEQQLARAIGYFRGEVLDARVDLGATAFRNGATLTAGMGSGAEDESSSGGTAMLDRGPKSRRQVPAASKSKEEAIIHRLYDAVGSTGALKDFVVSGIRGPRDVVEAIANDLAQQGVDLTVPNDPQQTPGLRAALLKVTSEHILSAWLA